MVRLTDEQLRQQLFLANLGERLDLAQLIAALEELTETRAAIREMHAHLNEYAGDPDARGAASADVLDTLARLMGRGEDEQDA